MRKTIALDQLRKKDISRCKRAVLRCCKSTGDRKDWRVFGLSVKVKDEGGQKLRRTRLDGPNRPNNRAK
jgi:hypothetical protein